MYGVIADNLTNPEGLKFIKIYLAIILTLSLVSLLILLHLFKAQPGDAPEQRNSIAVKRIRYGGMFSGSILILAPFFGWRAENYDLFIISYYLIALGLMVTSYLYHTHQKLLFIVFGLALGFFGDELYRLIRYDEPDNQALIFTLTVIACLFLGIFLVFRNIELRQKTLKPPSAG